MGICVQLGSDGSDRPGQFGPLSYETWRSTSLGYLTERLEHCLILRLAGKAKGRYVLDVGCGDGALALAFWRNGASRVVGCDGDPRMIARANARAAKHKAAIGYAVARAERLPFPDLSFDLVTLITVLAFLPEPALAVREIARVLRPGGGLVIGDLGKWSLWAASRRLRSWLGAPMWSAARFRSAGELRAVAEAAELRVDEICGAVYYPRCGFVAKLMAPVDPLLGRLTTFGAAVVAVRASKAQIRDVPPAAPVTGGWRASVRCRDRAGCWPRRRAASIW
jgi:ubiquinone/menaquinone biosynthesis C-methylase UbiE